MPLVGQSALQGVTDAGGLVDHLDDVPGKVSPIRACWPNARVDKNFRLNFPAEVFFRFYVSLLRVSVFFCC